MIETLLRIAVTIILVELAIAAVLAALYLWFVVTDDGGTYDE